MYTDTCSAMCYNNQTTSVSLSEILIMPNLLGMECLIQRHKPLVMSLQCRAICHKRLYHDLQTTSIYSVNTVSRYPRKDF